MSSSVRVSFFPQAFSIKAPFPSRPSVERAQKARFLDPILSSTFNVDEEEWGRNLQDAHDFSEKERTISS